MLLVHVADRQVCCGGSDDPALHQHDDLLRRLVENLGGRGSRARSDRWVTFSGRPAEHLLNATLEARADLLIVAGGRSGRPRDRAQLLRKSACPVFVLPPGPARDEETRGRRHRAWMVAPRVHAARAGEDHSYLALTTDRLKDVAARRWRESRIARKSAIFPSKLMDLLLSQRSAHR